ncbi:MAG: rhodanese-like domain-containing protein [Hyphomonas sp.]|nr:rhodanese-like domain-containing protein [Hyphomonas sp.]
MADKCDLTPQRVLEDLKAGDILLVDVREPTEFANERIHGALLHPLSTFEPKALPVDGSRRVVFQCGSGKRSRMALDAFVKATGADAAHLAGGIAAWKASGLPCIRLDPATGSVIDKGDY